MNSFDLKLIKNDLAHIQQILTPSFSIQTRLFKRPAYKIPRDSNDGKQINVENKKESRNFIMKDNRSTISGNNLLRKPDKFFTNKCVMLSKDSMNTCGSKLKLIEDEVRRENMESDNLMSIILNNISSSPYENIHSILKQ